MNRDIKVVTLLGLHIRYLDTAWPRGHSVFVSYDVLQLESLVGHRQTREHREQQDQMTDTHTPSLITGATCRCPIQEKPRLAWWQCGKATQFGLDAIRPGLFQLDSYSGETEIALQIKTSRILRRNMEEGQGEGKSMRSVRKLAPRSQSPF